MSQRTDATAPPGWQVAVEVDSRLEADLAARMLDVSEIDARVVEQAAGEFGVYVAEQDLDAATRILDIR